MSKRARGGGASDDPLRDLQGIEPTTIEPTFIGSVVDERLEGAYAVAVDAATRVA